MNLSILTLEPIFLYDSDKYLLPAEAIQSGTFDPSKLSIETRPGYPYLIAISKTVASSLGIAPYTVLIALQALMCLMIDLMVFTSARLLTSNPWIYFPASVLAVLSVETKLMAAAVMTEVPYLLLFTLFFPVFFAALRRNSAPLAVAAVTIWGVASWVRPFGAIVWPLPVVLWLAREVQQYVRKARRGPCSRQELRTLVLRSCAVVLGSYVAIIFITIPLRREGIGFHERLHVLWVQTVSLNSAMFEEFKRTDRYEAYRKDYYNWTSKREIPDNMEYEPAFLRNKPYYWFGPHWHGRTEDAGLTFWKAPRWVLMSERGYSLPESLRWQADTAIDLIARRPGVHLAHIANDWKRIFTVPPRIHSKVMMQASQPGEKDFFTRGVLSAIGWVSQINGWLYSTKNSGLGIPPIAYLYVPCFLGVMLGYAVYRPWEWTTLVLLISYHVFVTVALATSDPRYRTPLDVYFGVFVMGCLAGLGRLAATAARRNRS